MDFISCNTWMFGYEKKVNIDLEKRGRDYRIIMSLENHKVELSIDRDGIKTLRDKIENALLDE